MKPTYEQAHALAVTLYDGRAIKGVDDERDLWLNTFARVYMETEDAFKAEAAAEGAVKRLGLAMAVKAANGDPIIGGWAIMFGSPAVKDRANPATYFDNETEFLADYYQNAPLWINHEDAKRVVGERCGTEYFPGHGIWLNHRLYKDNPLFEATKAAIEAGNVAYSSDTFYHYINETFRQSDGYLSDWPLAGCSLIIGIPEAEPGLGPVRFIDPLDTDATAGRSALSPEAGGASVMATRTEPDVQTAKGLADAPPMNNEQNPTNGELNMDKEQLRQILVTALNLAPETTLEDIVGLLQQAIGAGTGEASAEMSAQPQLDMASVRSAAGLPDDADADAVADAVKGIIALATAPDAIQVNQEAMAKVFEAVAEARKSAPVQEREGGYVTVNGSKSSARYGSVNVNRGAAAPSLGRAIKALLAQDRKEIAANTKAQGATENVLGGYFLRDEISADILKPVYNQSSIMQAGVTRRAMTTETLTVRKNRGGSVAYWAGEHQTVSQSDVTLGQVDLVLKELVAENRQSRKALTYAEGLEQEIRDDLSMQMALALDLSALRGTGAKPAASGHSGAEPLGVRNTVASTQVTTLGSGNGAAPAISNLNKMIGNIKGRNFGTSNRWGWITSTRESQFLSGLTTTTGEPILRENWAGEMMERILGIPKYESNQVPTNLTTGTNADCSEVYLGDWQYAVVGIGKDVELVVDESVYRRERDVLIQAVMYADFGIFFREAFEVLAGVRGIIT